MPWLEFSSGTERKVYWNPDNQRLLKVSSLENPDENTRENLSHAFARFYVTKVLDLLYPDMFPHLYCIGERVSDTNQKYIVEQVEKTSTSDDEVTIRIIKLNKSIKLKQMQQLLQLEEEKKLKLAIHPHYHLVKKLQFYGIYLDNITEQNFVFSKTDQLYYIDRVEIDPGELLRSEAKIRSIIDNSLSIAMSKKRHMLGWVEQSIIVSS